MSAGQIASDYLEQYGFAAREVSFDVPMQSAPSWWREAFPEPEREIRYQLPPGQVFPKDIHRGRAVDMNFKVGPTTFRFQGRVKFRRLGAMVVSGKFV